MNLVGNAIKFTDDGEIVVASAIESDDDDGAVVRISVSDTGIGIPTEKLETIFAPFEQADRSTTRRFGGTGLGLYHLGPARQADGGDDLRFTRRSARAVPFPSRSDSESSKDDVPQRRSFAPKIQGLHVLIVDDNKTNRRILEEILANWGAICVSVAGGPERAGGHCQMRGSAHPFDFALLDGVMPGMDGYELAERIRRESPCPDLEIILLTSANRTDLNERCERARLRGRPAQTHQPVRIAQCDHENARTGGTVAERLR